MDAQAYRQASRERWERAASGWGAQREMLRRATEPVTSWLLDALGLRPGDTVLELAAGPGDTGLAALDRIRPGGRLVSTDTCEPMVDLVRERARELGVEDEVEARVMEAEWIDLPAASVDGVLCRWGYMLLADPAAALAETRRVLRPGRRVALAAWDAPERNPWASVARAELVAHGVVEREPPVGPHEFAWADATLIADRLEDAGFLDPEVETIAFSFTFPDADAWWDAQLDLSVGLRDAIGSLTPVQRDDLRAAIDPRLERYARSDGTLELPASAHVAAAEA